MELPALAEKDALPEMKTLLPSVLVKIFLGGGELNEVYTDQDLRLAYGKGNRDRSGRETLYIMTRATDSP